MVVKCKGVDRVSLITDSLRPAGLDVATSIAGSLENGKPCIIEDGVAKLPDRNAFAGSIATADRLVRTMWKKANVPLTDTIKMITENPAKLLKIEGAVNSYEAMERLPGFSSLSWGDSGVEYAMSATRTIVRG